MSSYETTNNTGNLIAQEDALAFSGLAVFSIPAFLAWVALYNNPKTKPFAIVPPALWAAALVYTVAR